MFQVEVNLSRVEFQVCQLFFFKYHINYCGMKNNSRRFEFFKTLFKYKFEITCQTILLSEKAPDFVFNYPSTIFIIYFI